jgi:phosphate-selective porin OprO/OprP
VIRYTRHIVFLIALAAPAFARAQGTEGAGTAGTPPADAAAGTAAPAVPAEPAPVPPPPPPPAAAAEAPRIDEIEQLARIAARKQELLEEEAAKRAKEAPRLTVDDKGFSVALPDRSFQLKFRGLVQADGRFFLDNDALEANDTFILRRLRPSFDGTVFSLIDFRMQPEFAGGATILDAYVDVHPWEWARLRVGKMKVPVGLERLQADADRVFLEQSLISNLSSQRDVGVELWGDIAGGLVHYDAGIYNGAPDTTAADTDINHAKDFAGRLFIHPFRNEALKSLGNLGIGVSAQTGNRKGRLPTAVAGLPIPSVPAQTGLSPFKTSGQNTFFQYLAPATDTTGAATVFGHERATRINPQLYYYYEGLGLLAEYMWLKQGVQKGNSTADLTNKSAAVTASFTIGGRENYDGTTPTAGFDPATGTLGALILAARWSWIAVDDATFSTYANPVASAKSANAYGGAITWVPRRSARFSASYEQTRFDGGAGTAASGMNPAVIKDRATEHVIICRTQVSF